MAMLGVFRERAAAAAVAAIVLGFGAAGVSSGAARKALRAHDRETTEQAIAAQRAAAAAEAVAALDARLEEASAAVAAAETKVADAEANITALSADLARADQNSDEAVDGLERTLAALLSADSQRQAGWRIAYAPIAAATAGRLIETAQSAEVRAHAAERRQEELSRQQADLAAGQALVESLRTALAALTAERRARAAAALGALPGDAVPKLAPTRTSSSDRDARIAPVRGAVLQRFGQATKRGPAKGLVYAAEQGALVLAPARGRIAYAGPFRSYGNILILDLENDYAVVLSGVDQVLAGVGETVLAGQPVAQMAPGAAEAPELYVEVRRSGRPVDPNPWFRSGRATAMK
jgi:septal ring factor EnvC (AmiA/AmiB activator)